METESERKAFDAIAAEARQNVRCEVEKLSLPRSWHDVGGSRTPGGLSGPHGRVAKRTETVRSRERHSFDGAVIAHRRPRRAAARAPRVTLRRQDRAAAPGGPRGGGSRRGAKPSNRVRRPSIGACSRLAWRWRAFAVSGKKYFARVEREVVQLALAIAARILHREALLDPLLLAGAVRVALGQLGETTGVRLRCPAEQVERWRELLGSLSPVA